MDDNVEQIKKDLQMFLYHLRLPAEVFVVPLVSEEITRTTDWLTYYSLLSILTSDNIRLSCNNSSITNIFFFF